MTLCFCRACPCNCGVADGGTICEPCQDGRHCQNGQHAEPDDTMRDALEGMVRQFAYWSDSVGGYGTGGLSALEDAFGALGWDDPHPAPEARCDEPGCMQQATCGWPTRPGGTGPNGGYRRTCGAHMRR